MDTVKRLLVVAAASVVSGTACAGTAVNVVTPTDYHQGQYNIGFVFNPTKTIDVTALGYYFGANDWIDNSHEVGIYQITMSGSAGSFDGQGLPRSVTSSTLVADAIVSNTDTLSGFFRYGALSNSVQLSASDEYAIVGFNGDDPYNISAPFSVDSAINFQGGAIAGAVFSGGETSFGPPERAYLSTDNGNFPAWATVNFQFKSGSTTPSPAAILPFALGLLRRRRRPAKA